MAGPQGKSYYDEQGSLHVWTGTGYHKVPTIAAGDVAITKPGYELMGNSGDQDVSLGWQPDSWGITDPAKYGLPDRSQNFMGGGTSQDELTYLLKSGDKEGTKIKFVRQEDGSYKPTYEGAERWDTNQSKRNMALLAIAAAPLVAYAGQALTGAQGVSSMTGAGGTALAGSADAALYGGMAGAGAASPGALTSYGVLDASAALPGTTITPAALTPPTMTTYGIVDKTVALPGTKFIDGGAGMLTSAVDKIKNAWGPVRDVLGAAGQLSSLGGGAPADAPAAPGAPGAATPANWDVGSMNFSKMPTGAGGRKPGPYAVPTFDPYTIQAPAAPQAPQAPGIMSNAIKT